MSTIRPQFPVPTPRPNTAVQTTGRTAAQRAFFEAAVQKTASAAYTPPQAEARPQTQNTNRRPDASDFGTDGLPKRFLKPGSFIDIKV